MHKSSGEARSVPRATAGTTGTGFVASDRFRTLTRPTTTKNDKVTIKEIIRKANRYTLKKNKHAIYSIIISVSGP
jgi:hypothetical protein